MNIRINALAACAGAVLALSGAALAAPHGPGGGGPRGGGGFGGPGAGSFVSGTITAIDTTADTVTVTPETLTPAWLSARSTAWATAWAAWSTSTTAPARTPRDCT